MLWLAIRIVDYANRERPKGGRAQGRRPPGLVGVDGHADDRALLRRPARARTASSVKPHASPVLHAIEYLLGRLDRTLPDDAARLRRPAGVPQPHEGSVPGRLLDRLGRPRLGRAALRRARRPLRRDPLRRAGPAAASSRCSATPSSTRATSGRRCSSRRRRSLGNVLWIVDLNRQSLDRVVPVIKAAELERQFETAGWHVIELKYGRRLREAFARDGGDLLRRRDRRDAEPALPEPLRRRARRSSSRPCSTALSSGERRRLARLLAAYDGGVGPLVQDLGGHDLARRARRARRPRAPTSTRPTVIFAYTIKGYGLPIAGRPLNHSALLTGAQIDRSASRASASTPTASGTLRPGLRRRARSARRRAPARAAAARPREHAIDVPATLSARRPPPRPRRRRRSAGCCSTSRASSGLGGAHRDRLARRERLDEPRRLDQQGRRLRRRRRSRSSTRRGLAARAGASTRAAGTSSSASRR